MPQRDVGERHYDRQTTVPGLAGDPGQVAPGTLWVSRGANPQAIRSGHCIVYELGGFYAFSEEPSETAQVQLRERVSFLIEDAPALQASINPLGPIAELDLGALYREGTGQAERFAPLAECGKNLFRSPVVEIGFGTSRGRLVVSQLITAGRLAGGYTHPEIHVSNPHYALRPDPAAQQFVLNLMRAAVK